MGLCSIHTVPILMGGQWGANPLLSFCSPPLGRAAGLYELCDIAHVVANGC